MPKYHIVVSGHQCGPYEPHELWAQGLSPGSLVWTEAMADWQEARNVPDLAPMFRQALVPPAPQYAPPAQYPQQPIAAPPAYASPPPASHPQQGQYPQPGQYAQPMQYAPPGQYPQPGGYGYPGQPQVNLVHVPVPYVPAKSVGVAFLLTFFFGPLGMLYSTVPGALIMICISFVAAIFTAGFSVPFTWIGCIIWGCVAASNSNGRMAAQVRRY